MTSKRKPNIWLWVLGWILIFPIPLTILMLRKRDMKPLTQYGIIGAAWILFIIFASSHNYGKNFNDATKEVDRTIPQQTNTQTQSTPTVRPTSKLTPKPTPTPAPTPEPTPTPTPMPTPGQKRSFKVGISRQRTDNNGTQVGSNWSYYYELNEKELKNGSSCSISAWDTITLYAKHAENDGNPDVGEKTMSYTVTESDVANGFTIEMNLSVTENGGRYSGLSADFTVKLKFTPQG